MKYLWFLLILIFFITSVNAATIGVNIAESLKGNLKSTVEAQDSIMVVASDFQNIGSVTYNERSRLDIFEGDNIIFTSWSPEMIVKPGEFESNKLYWAKTHEGNFSARLRIYYGGEIEEKEIKVPEMDVFVPGDNFQIYVPRVYGNTLRIFVKSKTDVKNLIVLPVSYPLGWIVEQEEAGPMEANQLKEVNIDFSAPEFRETGLELILMSSDGGYYTTEQISLKRESGFSMYLNMFLDWLVLKFV